jgi:hypothetical protein
MTLYMMSFTGADRQKILDSIDALKEIPDWFASTGAIFITTDKSAEWVSDKIRNQIPELNFLISPFILTDAQGWTSKSTWEFLQKYQ